MSAWRSRAEERPEIGARFRPTDGTAFGLPSTRVWCVKELYDASDGKTYVQLIDSSDVVTCKTVSVNALLHSGLYRRAT